MSHPPADGRARRALAAYAATWIVAGAACAALLILALRGCAADRLPPLERTDFVAAAREGDCRVLTVDEDRPGNPPAAGTAASPPASAGVYEEAPPVARLVGAARRGVVVIQYRRDLEAADVDRLELMQEVVPRATIVTPNTTRMPFLVAGVAWHHILGCRRFTGASLDALRLFRARNVGRGADTRP